jgi:hypothetical protein
MAKFEKKDVVETETSGRQSVIRSQGVAAQAALAARLRNYYSG